VRHADDADASFACPAMEIEVDGVALRAGT